MTSPGGFGFADEDVSGFDAADLDEDEEPMSRSTPAKDLMEARNRERLLRAKELGGSDTDLLAHAAREGGLLGASGLSGMGSRKYSPKTKLNTLDRSDGPRRRFSRHVGDAADHAVFRIEDGSETSSTKDRGAFMSNVILENPEMETRWYFKFFLGHSHANFIARIAAVDDRGEEVSEPVVLSMMVESDGSIRAILWRKTGSERLMTRGQRGKTPDAKKIIASFGHGHVTTIREVKLSEMQSGNMQQDLLVLEEQEGAVNFKIGVLYGKSGQTTDDEMFSNEHGSDGFEKFYQSLGSVKTLLGFTGFRGGLDVKNGTTGEHFVHTTEFGKEIVFHVSTLLSHSKENLQQLERKRHLGNDISNIIYQEDAMTKFKPDMIKSQFNHIFAVVSPSPSLPGYHLTIYTRNTVPEFGPPLPNPNLFPTLEELRHFLIVKLLNGEKAALGSPVSTFAKKRERTLEMLVQEIHRKFEKNVKRTLTRGSTTKGANSSEDFRSQGQLLKVKKIASGVAPTSSLSSHLSDMRDEPWMPICITSKLEPDTMAADAWLDGSILLSAAGSGMTKLKIEAHQSGMLESTRLVDASVVVVQVDFDFASHMVFIRTALKVEDADEGKGGALYAAPVEEFAAGPLNKKTIKQFLVPSSKGCNLFAVNTTTASTASMLRKTCKLAVAVGKKLKTYQFVAKNPTRVPGQGSGGTFTLLNEYPCADQIVQMTVTNAGGTSVVCAAFRSDFAIINLELNELCPINTGSRAQIYPIGCAQVGDPNNESLAEFVLCFNNTAIFVDHLGNPTREYDVKFNSQPHAVACVYPYLLGFTTNSIEVVTMINGSLVKTIAMPGCQFLSNKKGVHFKSQSDETTSLYKMSHEALSGESDSSYGAIRPDVGPGNVFARRLSNVTLETMRKPGGPNLTGKYR